MKYYIVQENSGALAYDYCMLVKANNKKEALDSVWQHLEYDREQPQSITGYKPHYQKDFIVTDVKSFFKDIDDSEDNCIVLY